MSGTTQVTLVTGNAQSEHIGQIKEVKSVTQRGELSGVQVIRALQICFTYLAIVYGTEFLRKNQFWTFLLLFNFKNFSVCLRDFEDQSTCTQNNIRCFA
jgi:hypothetical protein